MYYKEKLTEFTVPVHILAQPNLRKQVKNEAQ